MIFYFSGTGNSLYAAKSIAQAQGEQIISIAAEMKKAPAEHTYTLGKEERIGFVYPIYAWGPPKIVIDFINTVQFNCDKPYVFSIGTCGGSEGNATKLLQKALSSKGLSLDSAFSLVMPSNYIIGEDVSSKNKAAEILRNAEERLKYINEIIKKRQTGVFELISGGNPLLHTSVINPLFNRFARTTKKFTVTDECTRCGLCQKICPVKSITLEDKPVWSKACIQCLGCINRCPAHAIQYGEATKNRGRYTHPDLKVSD